MSLDARDHIKFASSRMIGCIDIVKEEFDRLLISFQVRFEKILSDKVKIRRRSGGYLFPSPRISLRMSFAEKRSSVEGLLTDALA